MEDEAETESKKKIIVTSLQKCVLCSGNLNVMN